MRDLMLQGSIMRSQLQPASAATGRESEYAIERKTRAHTLNTADALRAEERRISYATIDSSASKWRYSTQRDKS